MPNQHRGFIRRVLRGFGIALAGVVLLSLIAAGAVALWLWRGDLEPIVERAASAALGRSVTLDGLAVRWGDPVHIEASDLAIANAAWGSKPEMIRIGRISARIDPAPLLQGVLHYERLRIADASIALERDADGTGNWEFGAATDGFALVPKDRTEFPTLVDFAGERGHISYRTRGGNLLQVRLDHVALSSPGADSPVSLTADGAYGDVPLRLDATTESYEILRDRSIPFGARFTLQGRDTDLAFNGTLWDPLDFDGVRGELSIEARTLRDLLGVMNVDADASLPLSLAGILRRDGERWIVAAAKGALQQSPFSGSLALNEGAARAPDAIELDLDFSTLDLDAMAGAIGGPERQGGLAALPLGVGGLSGTDVTAAITALRVRLGARDWHAAALRGHLADGTATVEELSAALGGGTLSLAGTLTGQGSEGRLDLGMRLSKANLQALARDLGMDGSGIQGRLDGRATLSMTGPTIGAALTDSEGAAVLLLREGAIARSLIERLSTDLRSLFRSREGTVPVSCLLAVVTMKDGVGVLSPLRLESRAAIAVGAGKIDLVHDRLDLIVRTERDSTSFFALDIPVRISGPFDDLNAEPMVGTDVDWLKRPAAAAGDLPPELRRLAAGSGCRA